jgi:hypothetical protein
MCQHFGKKPIDMKSFPLLLPFSCLCVAELLGFCHRMYDATTLVFALAWALMPLTRGKLALRKLALPVILLVGVLTGSGSMTHWSATII